MYISFLYDYQGNTNTCKVTDNSEFIFSQDYLNKHLDTLHFYINSMVLKNQVTKVMIKEKDILPSIEKFINLYSIINELHIEEDKPLDISDTKIIMNMPHIKKINCYDIEEKNYYDLSKKYSKEILLRSEVLFQSNFMKYNNMNNFTNLYQIKEVKMNEEFNEYDKEEFEYLLKHNRNLERITLNRYSDDLIKYLIPLLKKKKIILSINNDLAINTKQAKYLKKLKRTFKIQLELSYSEQYQYKNALKQLNLNILRFCMVLVVFVCVGFVSAEHFIFESDKEETEKIDLTKYEEFVDDTSQIEETDESSLESEESNSEEITNNAYVSPYYQTYTQVFSELKQINPDTVGWIKVNNTNVNYPVVKSSDNEYYLNHSFDNSTNSFGWIYADYRSNFDTLNQNTIIYGHNVLGTNLLFSTLTKTIDSSWYNNNSNLTITFNTENENMKWQIFSIYLIPVTNDYLITNFNSSDSFLAFVQKLKDRSIKDFGVEVNGNDKILTLSTCYKDSSQRVVIHAKRVA